MREATGSTWTMALMLGFIMIFVSFLAVTISYSKAFRVKNEIISIIEKYGGYNDTSAEIINNYIKASGYFTTGSCGYSNDGNSIGVTDLSNKHTTTYSNRGTYYCIKKEKANGDIAISNVVYEVKMFYRMNIPAFGRFATFTVKGKTTDMLDPNNPNNDRNNKDLFYK